MKTFILSAIAVGVVVSALLFAVGPVRNTRGAVDPVANPTPSTRPNNKTMRAFGSEQELSIYLKQLAKERERELARAQKEQPMPSSVPAAAPSLAKSADAKSSVNGVAKDE